MNIGKKIICAIFIISLLAIVGCTQQGGPLITRSTPFVGGSDAIEPNFIAGEPPEESLDEDQLPFAVTVSLENKGEWDVAKEDISIELRGFRSADFNSPQMIRSPDEDLKKKYIDGDGNVIPGTFTHLTFDDFSYLGTVQAANEFPILADVCYKYGTIAQIDLCYLKDVTDLTKVRDVCEIQGSKPVFSSSAPVSVENSREELGGIDKISFSFDVVHRSNGLLSRIATTCNDEADRADKNVVWVEVDTGLTGLTCSGISDGTATTGYVTLFNGKRNIRCTQENPGDGDYIKKATVILKYDYKDTVKTSILIKHIIS